MTQTFRDRLTSTIEAQGLTMKALSLRAGFNESYVRDIIRRDKAPTIPAFMALASALGVSPTWLLIGENTIDPVTHATRQVPLLSRVSAGMLKSREGVREADIERYLQISDLPAGSWFALTVEGDSMDRLAPDGSTILVNRADDALVDGRFYVFGNENGEATFKRFRRGDRTLLQPFSLNPDHMSIPVDETEVYVFGRVRRVIIDV